jgi:hypothetical protein
MVGNAQKLVDAIQKRNAASSAPQSTGAGSSN